MILYFSGSGNTQLIASCLNEYLNDEIVSLNDVIKNKKDLIFNSKKPFVFIAPIYAWRYPLIVENLIKESSLEGNNKVYFLATMGLNCGDTEKFLEKIILNKNLIYMGFNKIIMPSNFVISEEVVDETTSIKIINEALKNIKHLANLISNEEKFEVNKKEKHGYFYSSILNYGFNKYFKTSKYFKVDNDACLKCHKCIEVCPLNNILMVNDKITFNNNCMFCLSCINHCPINAITYKNNKNGTYLCPIDHFKTKK